MALLFLTHQIGISIFRVIATASRNIVVANAGGMLLLLCVFLMNGFVIRRSFIHPWVIWYAWCSICCLQTVFAGQHAALQTTLPFQLLCAAVVHLSATKR